MIGDGYTLPPSDFSTNATRTSPLIQSPFLDIPLAISKRRAMTSIRNSRCHQDARHITDAILACHPLRIYRSNESWHLYPIDWVGALAYIYSCSKHAHMMYKPSCRVEGCAESWRQGCGGTSNMTKRFVVQSITTARGSILLDMIAILPQRSSIWNMSGNGIPMGMLCFEVHMDL